MVPRGKMNIPDDAFFTLWNTPVPARSCETLQRTLYLPLREAILQDAGGR